VPALPFRCGRNCPGNLLISRYCARSSRTFERNISPNRASPASSVSWSQFLK
jgi:hypothetical protein